MAQRIRTEQENFWAGEFGDAYVRRNANPAIIASNRALFARILARASEVESVLELGANVGLNLVALHDLLPSAALTGLEINANAIAELRKHDWVQVEHGSLLDYEPSRHYDLVFTKGVLIHVNPADLPLAYDALYRSSARYVCVAEYYNPSPVSVPYRGHSERLFKRDFAGDILARCPSLRLIDYGFVYHRDPLFPQHDLTWFLLEKAR